MTINGSRPRTASREDDSARWSPLRLLKTALVAGAALQAGGYLGYSLSERQRETYEGAMGGRPVDFLGGLPMLPASLPARRALRPQGSASLPASQPAEPSALPPTPQPVPLPTLERFHCEPVAATVNGPHGGAVATPRLGFVDEVLRLSSTQLQVRGWTTARALNFVTPGTFADVQVTTQRRPDVAAATGYSACSGFVATLRSEQDLPRAGLRLSVFGQTDQGTGTLVNPYTLAVDAPALPPLTLRYDTCDAGLANQVYAHLSALSLAHALGAEAQLSSGQTRSSFADYNEDVKHPDPALQLVRWSPLPLGELLDTEQLKGTAARHGLRVRTAAPGGTSEAVVVAQHPILQRQFALPDLVQNITAQAAEHLARLPAPVPSLTISMPCPFLWVADLYKDPFAVDVARSLQFPPKTLALASRAVDALQGRFSGVHLRMEEDARGAVEASGGEAVYWQSYVDASQEAKLDPEAPIYLSTGLLSYGNDAVVDRFKAELLGLGYRGNIVHKESLFSKAELEALAPEAQAVLDLAVMAKADKVVGARWSSFSILLQQLRALHGRDLDTTVLAGNLRHPEGYFRLVP